MHGVLDIGRVVFQAQDEELVLTEHSEPVQQIHGIQADLEPHLAQKHRAQESLPNTGGRLLPQRATPSTITPSTITPTYTLKKK